MKTLKDYQAEELIRNVEEEYKEFREKTQKLDSDHIYNSFDKIYVYYLMHNFFTVNEDFIKEYFDKDTLGELIDGKTILRSLYKFVIDSPEIPICSFQYIEELLSMYLKTYFPYNKI